MTKEMATYAEAIIKANIKGIVKIERLENGNIMVYTKNVFATVKRLDSIRMQINASDVEISTRYDNVDGMVYTFVA